jgi:D-alanyl-D-alanine carboxypeptidase
VAICAVAVFMLLGLAPAHARYASLVIDAASGQVLHERGADETRHPASLTKLMTLYLIFEAVTDKRISFSTKWAVSDKAAGQPPTKLGLENFDFITVRDVVLGLITRSANDAAVVAAEGLGGSVTRFAQMMNNKARELGMSRTHFENPNGLPDPDQVTSARDMARLGRALIYDFPNFYPLFATEEFIFNGRVNANHNRLMERYKGMDGLKTGYIRASGFNLVASAVRNGRRLIGVVIGGPSPGQRDNEMAHLLDAAFTRPAGKPALPDMRVAEAPTPLPKIRITDDPPGLRLTEPLALKAPPPPGPQIAAATPTIVLKPPAGQKPAVARGTPAVVAEGDDELPMPSPPRPAHDDDWGVQVGTFKRPEVAKYAAQQALKVANKALDGGDVEIATAVQKKVKSYSARIVGLSQPKAREACKILGPRKDFDCMVIGPSNTKASRVAANN